MAFINFHIGSPKTIVFELKDSEGEVIDPSNIEMRVCSSTTKKYFAGVLIEDIELPEGQCAYKWDTTNMTVGSLDLEVLDKTDEANPIIIERQSDFGYADESSMDSTYTDGNPQA